MRENMGVPTPFRSDQPHNEYTRDLLHLEQCVPSVAEVITSPLAMVNSGGFREGGGARGVQMHPPLAASNVFLRT